MNELCDHGVNKDFSCTHCYYEKFLGKLKVDVENLQEKVQYLLHIKKIQESKQILATCKYCNGKGHYYE